MMVRPETIAEKAEAVASQQGISRSASAQVQTGIPASPLARKLAANLNLDLTQATGSGPRGKIYKEDILAVASSGARNPSAAASPASKTEEKSGDLVSFNAMRRTIAQRMSESKFSAPHVYFFSDVNMDRVMAFKSDLKKSLPEDLRFSVNDIFIKLTALVLKKFPLLNATVEGDGVRLWDQVNMGLAVALEDGLIVPAIPDADKLRFQEIAEVRKELVDKARSGKLTSDEMSRGTFTISSLAKSRITHFTAIVNPPQSAILSVGPTQEKPVVENGEIRIHRMATLGVSVDHRIIDGTMAADFLSELTDFLENAGEKLIAYL